MLEFKGEMLMAFWEFVRERQKILHRRNAGMPAPWTFNDVLRRHRFTNVYRASDRVSQYLIREVQYDQEWDQPNLVFRTLLFRIYNKIETWEMLSDRLGDEPSLYNWSVPRYSQIMDEWMAEKQQLWTSAYMVTPPVFSYGHPKHYGWNIILDKMIREALPGILGAPGLGVVFDTLREYDTVGNFFAWQWTVDLNYSPLFPSTESFSENSFVVPGPGAVRGARKLFGPRTDALEAIQFLSRDQYIGLMFDFPYLGGHRTLSWMDIQNCLCEFDKYCRAVFPEVNDGTGYYNKIKQRYDWTRPLPPFKYQYPPKWDIPESDANAWIAFPL